MHWASQACKVTCDHININIWISVSDSPSACLQEAVFCPVHLVQMFLGIRLLLKVSACKSLWICSVSILAASSSNRSTEVLLWIYPDEWPVLRAQRLHLILIKQEPLDTEKIYISDM